MRHKVFGKKLNRDYKKRQALFKGLITALIEKGRIQTTEAKAKAVKGLIDNLVNKAKRNDLTARRLILARLPNKKIVEKLFKEVVPATGKQKSGFTRIIRLKERKGDGAKMVILEWIYQLAVKTEKETKGKNQNLDKKVK